MERLMQYVWQHRLWLACDMRTTAGEPVDVLDTGLLNTNAGPDFFNAKIRIADRTWVGNVEIHVRASDWHRHGHDSDHAYDSVILHVVGEADTQICRPDGQPIPTVVLPCAPDFHKRYADLVNRPLENLACAAEIPSVDKIYLSDWIQSLAFERLQNKAQRIHDLAGSEGGDWSYAVWVTLARALGFGTNAEPFERLALSLPLRTLRKHADSLLSVESLIFGMAGFLDDAPQEVYPQRMLAEYRFLAAKFNLRQPSWLGWKMARMRPANFPHRRLATLAAIVHQGFTPGYKIFDVHTLEQARELFDIILEGYWATRYQFGAGAAPSSRAFSPASLDGLVINVVAPALFAYGSTYGRGDMSATAIELLQQIPAENNKIVRLFSDAGIEVPDAFTSQALIEARRQYCQQRKCLYCRLGHRLLTLRAKP